MNARTLIAAAALAFAGTSAFAGGEFDPMTGFNLNPQPAAVKVAAKPAAAPASATQAGLTRDQVKAEFARARDNGELVSFDTGIEYAQAPKATSTLTREQVREETRLALKNARVAAGS